MTYDDDEWTPGRISRELRAVPHSIFFPIFEAPPEHHPDPPLGGSLSIGQVVRVYGVQRAIVDGWITSGRLAVDEDGRVRELDVLIEILRGSGLQLAPSPPAGRRSRGTAPPEFGRRLRAPQAAGRGATRRPA